MPSPPTPRRFDVALVECGLAESSARAQALILGGSVTIDGQVVTKPATAVPPGSNLALLHPPNPYVSRGGLKLQHALEHFRLPVAGRVAIDAGASTGGFTDALLQAGATRVYAVDVGYGQLAWRLRSDPRVVVMERTNIKSVDTLPEPVDLAVVDVSFISLQQVLPVLRRLLTPGAEIVALIKPQFEAGRERVGKGGVVRDPAVWGDVLRTVITAAQHWGFGLLGLECSPLRGPAGNVEFLAHFGPPAGEHIAIDASIARVIDTGERLTMSSAPHPGGSPPQF